MDIPVTSLGPDWRAIPSMTSPPTNNLFVSSTKPEWVLVDTRPGSQSLTGIQKVFSFDGELTPDIVGPLLPPMVGHLYLNDKLRVAYLAALDEDLPSTLRQLRNLSERLK